MAKRYTAGAVQSYLARYASTAPEPGNVADHARALYITELPDSERRAACASITRLVNDIPYLGIVMALEIYQRVAQMRQQYREVW